jgi:hypothetical protein
MQSASTGKVMPNVFWDSEGILLAELLERGATINLERYMQTLKKLKQQIQSTQPNRKMNQVILLDDNTRLHKGGNCNNEAGCSPSSPYSPDLAPADLNLFGSLTDALRGCHFAENDKLKRGVHEQLQCFSKVFYVISPQCFTQRWKQCADNGTKFAEK